jgi:hypothetical protein
MENTIFQTRRECGFTHVELGKKTVVVQTLVFDYERSKRLSADVIPRFAPVPHRLGQVEASPVARQTALLRTIDTSLEGAAARAARRA